MFYGEKLKQLRELQGFSRNDLAKKLSLTEQTIGQYENNQITPRLDIMEKLLQIFHVDLSFFNTPSFVEKNVISEESIAYRTKDRNSRKKINNELKYIDYAKTFIDYFESFVTSNIGGFNELKQKIEELKPKDYTIAYIADIVRDFYRLNENRELMSELEQSGITVLEKDLGSSIDAYSGFTNDNEPYIVLGNLKKTAVRRNFDLAHELGHLLLHSNIVMTEITEKEHTAIENQANDFASALLLPKYEFIKDFSNIARKTNPDYYIALKRKYMVSIAALEYRAYKLKLITYQGNRYFWSQMTKKKYRNLEPLDNKIPPLKPSKVKNLLSFLFDNELITMNELTNLFGIKKEFLISLFDLKDDFFDKYITESKTFGDNQSNLIDFELIRNQLTN
ncbi:XRE family transcriptional regulator [Lactobacillus johnsonii]|uniref:HTH cro/C1-type domain-containing protein n=1 Tax=Lactobacillus johnsonii (strain CNCM I-12250 / La1 / NCC 533) TaxID=257314 RepID=Q74JQ4_LACJO|nr:XRE family transcriptional regulator [Lactobacillus johnsonii]AAS08875.1 hypothetical protein LJ_1054 [Lactobacillus johnsonii NCC 533]MCT3321782.1 ImmA/IrrE family metallo-endopeptidase [Lactobacillus johnsonii]MCT3340726.1 ImmA/IrrE family metallo-endopeptidase [Lactobacillus johnsonii]MCT3389405.1 ImmA/IrrE family metallo-endopeptidase [Lactobacillus johnsonii]